MQASPFTRTFHPVHLQQRGPTLKRLITTGSDVLSTHAVTLKWSTELGGGPEIPSTRTSSSVITPVITPRSIRISNGSNGCVTSADLVRTMSSHKEHHRRHIAGKSAMYWEEIVSRITPGYYSTNVKGMEIFVFAVVTHPKESQCKREIS